MIIIIIIMMMMMIDCLIDLIAWLIDLFIHSF